MKHAIPNRTLVSAIIILNSVCLSGQFDQLAFQKLKSDRPEFSLISVQDILQDKDGFLWFGTDEGLYRFDGHGFRVYKENPLDPKSLPDNTIFVLEEDLDGNLWGGSQNAGIFRYAAQKDEFTLYTHEDSEQGGLSDNQITDILVATDGQVWAGTRNGLNYWDKKRDKFFQIDIQSANPNTRISNSIRQIEQDLKGRIWIGTNESGLGYLDPQTKKFVQLPFSTTPLDSAIYSTISSLITDYHGDIWTSTEDGGLFRIKLENEQIDFYQMWPPGDAAPQAYRGWRLLPDPRGGIWIGTHGKGLIYFNPETGTVNRFNHDISKTFSIASDIIFSLYLDNNKTLWAGHAGDGVSQAQTLSNGMEQIPFNLSDGQFPSILSFLEDSKGNYWIGTWGHGLYRKSGITGEVKMFVNNPANDQSLKNNMVWDILEGRDGGIWLGTHSGLQKYDPQRGVFTNYGFESGLKYLAVKSLHEDRSGRLWIGTFGGLHCMDEHTGHIFYVDTIAENPNLIINDIIEDRAKNIWVATSGQGVFRLDAKNNTWVNFKRNKKDLQSITSNEVTSMIEDNDGQIWLATEGGGLNLLVPDHERPALSAFRHWRTYNSDIINETIYKILPDNAGNIWLGTAAGLASFHIKTQKTNPYSLKENMPHLRIRTRPGRSGFLYFGSPGFLYRFNPDSLKKNSNEPPVFITNFSLNNRVVPIRGSFGDSTSRHAALTQSILYTHDIQLRYWQNNLNFEFSALNFIEPEKNQYQYQLEGYDEGWIPTDATRRFASYTNLDWGHYIFKVKGSNNDGRWGEETTLKINILPPWWATIWAYLSYLLAFSGLLYGVYSFQLRRKLQEAENIRLKELDTAKSRLYTNISHEFRTPLTVILGLVDNLTGKVYESGKESLKVIKRNAHQLLHLVNQMLDLARLDSSNLHLKLVRGDVIRYIRYLLESFHSYAANKNITIDFQAEAPSLEMDFDPDRFQQVISNLLSNAIKFTPSGGEIKVRVREANKNKVRRLQLYIRDTGIGIPEAKIPFIFDRFYQADDSSTRTSEGAGIGLALTRELVQLMGGEITVSSKAGKGTRFAIHLPVTREAEKTEAIPLPDSSDVLFTPEAESRLPPHDSPEKESALSILLIEDNPDVLRYLSGCLTPAYRIETAGNGEQGITKAIQQIPDLIISDIMMPVRDGFEVCDTLKKDERTSHIPIILLTAKADQASKLTGLAKGADAYLPKPFSKAELLIRIQNLLKNRERLRQFLLAGESQHLYPEKSLVQVNAEKTALKFIHKVRSVVESHISNPQFSVAMLAELIHYSEPQLNRKVKGIIDMTPGKYIRSVRLALAQRLLSSSDLSITDIAFECGFLDPEYFSKVFKQETELTPTEYRNLNG